MLFVSLCEDLIDTLDPLTFSVVAYGLPTLDAEDCLDCVFPLLLLIVVLTVDAADGHLLLARLLTPLEHPDDDAVN